MCSNRSKRPHHTVGRPAFNLYSKLVTFFFSKYPKINLKLRAPIELENLLPFDLQYRIYDKNADQNWRSYLRKGGVMPVHSVELGHLVLLNVNIQDTGKSSSACRAHCFNGSGQHFSRVISRLSIPMDILISRLNLRSL